MRCHSCATFNKRWQGQEKLREGGGKLAAKEGRENRCPGTKKTPGKASILTGAMRAG